MQSESGATLVRQLADQVVDSFAGRADKEQLSPSSERSDEFSRGCDPFGCRWRLQDSKHASWQRNAMGHGESNGTSVPWVRNAHRPIRRRAQNQLLRNGMCLSAAVFRTQADHDESEVLSSLILTRPVLRNSAPIDFPILGKCPYIPEVRVGGSRTLFLREFAYLHQDWNRCRPT